MKLTKDQVAMMAAHVTDLASAALRSGDHEKGRSLLEYARDLLTEEDPDDFYREALLEAGYPFDGVDDAVYSIATGEHPVDSLPGKIRSKHLSEAFGYGLPAVRAHLLRLLGVDP